MGDQWQDISFKQLLAKGGRIFVYSVSTAWNEKLKCQYPGERVLIAHFTVDKRELEYFGVKR